MTRPQRILLLGMMGCGKTTVGRELSTLSGWPYLDNDTLLRQATGKGPDELGLELGPHGLHELELQQLVAAVAHPEPAILGGAASIIERPGIGSVLEKCFVVYLRAKVETLVTRVGGGAGRPWLVGHDMAEVLAVLLEARGALWEDAADIVVDVDQAGPAVLSHAIWNSYEGFST